MSCEWLLMADTTLLVYLYTAYLPVLTLSVTELLFTGTLLTGIDRPKEASEARYSRYRYICMAWCILIPDSDY